MGRTSLSTALAGLNAHASSIDVVGNNLANLNTTGYKANVASFRDLVAQSLAADGATTVGLGVAPPRVSRQLLQGAIQGTGGSMDAAIQGDGYFILRNSQNASMYTRAGNFHVDAKGILVTSTKETVQGWSENSGVLDTNGTVGDITLPLGALQPPKATTEFSINMNLNAGAQTGDAFSTPIRVFDSLGEPHILTVTFTRAAAPGQWDYAIKVPGTDVGSTNATVTVLNSSSPLTFDSTGKLTAPAADITGIQVTGLASGAADMDVKWQLFSTGAVPRITQFAQASAISANSQDGSAPSQLISVAIADGGRVVAQFSNGQQRIVAQLALASIRNPDSLLSASNNNFLLGADSALPAVGVADTGGRGKVTGGALESSNVDIAQEFTNLIILQRGYQANSRVITTSDELSQETLNLKR